MYKILRWVLFHFDPESVHSFAMKWLKLVGSIGFLKKILSRRFAPSSQREYFFYGLCFRNPVGLGAGFDKNAAYLNELEMLGFGAVEIGTVTPLPQNGNTRPRLFRLPHDKALINRMGFNNEGADAIAARLKEWRKKQSHMIIGGNIGKNKITPNEDAWTDYEICFHKLYEYVDYFVVNVSSPNTPGLRELQEKASLDKILSNLQMINQQKPHPKPILLKIAPDLSQQQIDDVIDLAMEIDLDGLVVTNTTISRNGLSKASEKTAEEPGGLSGLPVKKMSTDILRYIHIKTQGKIPIIASGGIFTAADAREKLEAGASLLQIWTGFIYEGPMIVKKIVNNL